MAAARCSTLPAPASWLRRLVRTRAARLGAPDRAHARRDVRRAATDADATRSRRDDDGVGTDDAADATTPPWTTDASGGVVFTAFDIASATGGTLVRDAAAGSVTTDTRDVAGGKWFLALVGETRDAHEEFVNDELQNTECVGVISSRPPPGSWRKGYVQTACDPTTALQRLASDVRDRFPPDVVVVGVTGSVGKTTTRALTARALASLGVVHQTSGNFNNQVGLPLTLLKTPPDVRACVLELGMSALGEISTLAKIARPTVRLVTRVAPAHLSGVGGDIRGVARAKAEMFDGASAGDVCVVNADDEHVAGMTIPDGVRVVTFGAAAAAAAGGTERDGGGGGRPPDVSYDDVVSRALKGLSFTLRAAASDEKVAVSLPAPGAHMASNAAAACACAVAAGVSLEDAAKGVEAFESDDAARLRVVETPGSKLTIVDDAYNASPASVLAALRVMKDAMDQDQEYEEEEEKFEAKEKQEKEEPKAESEAKSKSKAKAKAKSKSKPKPQMKKPTKPRPPKVKKTKTFVLLGDMLELGEASKQHHEDVIEACLDAGFDKIGLAGPEFVEALRVFFPKRNVQSVVIAKDVEDLWDIIEGTQIIGPNARVLVKGSRGMKMDYIVDRLRSREGA